MSGQRLIIKTDVEDWRQEFQKLEPILQTDEDVIAFVMEGHRTSQAARLIIVARELGESPMDIINPNKLLLQSGAREEIYRKIQKVRETIVVPSGKEYEVRTYIGTRFQSDEEESAIETDASYVEADSKAGLQLAINYLDKTVPAFIFERFKQVVMRRGDLFAAADRLHSKIDELVGRLTEPPTP